MIIDIGEEQMLMRLIPDQVAEYWEFFAPSIQKSLPPTMRIGSDTLVNILEAVLMEELTVWALVDEDNQQNYRAVLTTQLNYERISKTRNLLIYSFTASGELTFPDWELILDKLKVHSRVNNCASIIAYSANQKIVEFLSSQGASVDNSLIRFEV